MNIQNQEEMVQRAVESIAPLVVRHADDGERDRRLATPVVDAMAEAGLFRLLTPRALGGLEVPPRVFYRAVEEVSRLDASTGWCLFNCAAGAVQGAFIGDDAAAEIFADDPHVITAGAVFPMGRAEVAPAGYIVSGRWSYASGVHHSRWLRLFCNVYEGGEPRRDSSGVPEVRVALVPTSAATVHDTWSVSGLAGTGSHDISVDGAPVPASFTFLPRPGAPRGSAYQGPLYRFPFWGVFACPIAAVALGVAQGALDRCLRAPADARRNGRPDPLRDSPRFQGVLGDNVAQHRAARAGLYAAVQACWDAAERGLSASIEARTEMILAAVHATRTSASIVSTLFTEIGGGANYRRDPLQRALRDVHAATLHVGVAPHWLEEGGRMLLGHAPTRPMILL